jgi:hypothetical protein
MAVDLAAIHRAAATQIQNALTRLTNVYPFPQDTVVYPCVTVYPGAGEYIDYWKTMGPNGNADMMLRLKVEVDSESSEAVAVKICDYLSVGTGHTSSIVDAVMADRTLGGTVEDALVLSAEWVDPDSSRGVAWLPVSIILKKQNAEVA